MACRNTASADLAAKDIQQHPYKELFKSTKTGKGKIMVEYLDLSSFKSVRAFVRRFSGREDCKRDLVYIGKRDLLTLVYLFQAWASRSTCLSTTLGCLFFYFLFFIFYFLFFIFAFLRRFSGLPLNLLDNNAGVPKPSTLNPKH